MSDERLTDAQEARIREILEAVSELDGDERDAAVAELTDDDAVRRAVAQRMASAFASAETAERASLASAEMMGGTEMVPQFERIAGYTVKSVIQSGGMGTVFLAQQDEPRRVVALKIMKPGLASRSARRRFEFEAQTLARLRHPNIATIYEAGTHDGGQGGVPFFAMEYVPGARTLTDYAVSTPCSTRERIELFIDVCNAVHHGHQKGIIHRDLKPANILVDGEGRPKVIDFGIARATDSDLAQTDAQTNLHDLVGTLQYMSPEQCAGDPHDLDTRSDVYALGVILYELLSNELPYSTSSCTPLEAARIVREAPHKPLREHGEAFGGDLETITHKALEREKGRRYESASALGRDLRRYLDDEPIEARPPSAAYQLRKFVRRNRAVVFGIGGTALAVVVGLVLSVIFGLGAARARDDLARGLTENTALLLLNDLLAGGSRDTLEASDGSPDPSLVALIERTEQRLDTLDDVDPAIAYSVYQTLGLARFRLGDLNNTIAHLERSLAMAQSAHGVSPDRIDEIKLVLAQALVRHGRNDEALALAGAAVQSRARRHGADDLVTVKSTMTLGMVHKFMYQDTRAERDWNRAVEYYEDAADALGAIEHPTAERLALENRFNVALLHLAKRDLDGALDRMTSVRDDLRAAYGRNDEDTMNAMSETAALLARRASASNDADAATVDREKAVAAFEEVIPLQELMLGATSFRTMQSKANYGRTLQHLGRHDEATAPLRTTLTWYIDQRPAEAVQIAVWLLQSHGHRGAIALDAAQDVARMAVAARDEPNDSTLRTQRDDDIAELLVEAGEAELAERWRAVFGAAD